MIYFFCLAFSILFNVIFNLFIFIVWFRLSLIKKGVKYVRDKNFQTNIVQKIEKSWNASFHMFKWPMCPNPLLQLFFFEISNLTSTVEYSLLYFNYFFGWQNWRIRWIYKTNELSLIIQSNLHIANTLLWWPVFHGTCWIVVRLL